MYIYVLKLSPIALAFKMYPFASILSAQNLFDVTKLVSHNYLILFSFYDLCSL